jgi:peptidyl-prolyl cis-trans isomerase-like protein 2
VEKENSKRLKDDDIMTWTGKRLGEPDEKPGHLVSSLERQVDQDALVVDTEQMEPVKKKAKAGGFGSFDGW